MKNTLKVIMVLALLWGANAELQGQGFVNLNFEHPVLPLSPDGGSVLETNAIPGWAAYTFGALVYIGYNAVSLGGSIVTLNDTNASGSATALRPIQGSYSVLLYASQYGPYAPAGVGQTGEIPITAKTLSFIASIYGTFQVAFNGQPISYIPISSTSTYTAYGADISTYAGQTGELSFFAISPGMVILDNIQFSSTAVPEPGPLALIGLGLAVCFIWRKRSALSL